MNTTTRIRKNRKISADDIKQLISKLSLSQPKLAQINAILCIGSDDKTGLIPFICQVISEQSTYFFAECADYFSESLPLSHEAMISVYLRPEIKEFLSSEIDLSNDHETCQFIDCKFEIEHPKEKIAYLYKMGKLGSVYAQLSAGSRMSSLDEDPSFLFDMPFLAREMLKKGIENLHARDTDSIKLIRSSMSSLIVEAHVKYIKASLDCGYSISDLIDEITWITSNSPNHHRWKKLVSKTKELDEIFS
jgi:hypothetical protein